MVARSLPRVRTGIAELSAKVRPQVDIVVSDAPKPKAMAIHRYDARVKGAQYGVRYGGWLGHVGQD